METYHLAWLRAHPERSPEWLAEKLADGFHVHHVDGDHQNDEPGNLILIDGIDHLHLHAGRIVDGIKSWRLLVSAKGRAAQAASRQAKQEPKARPYTRARVKFTPGTNCLTAALRAKASAVIAAGGGTHAAASAIFEESELSWRDLKKAIRREVA